MEDYWHIETPDGATLHGILDHGSQAGTTAKACVIIIHGLTGHPHEYIHERAAGFFTGHGYDVVRPYLYGGENGRALVDCTLQTHAADINTILENLAGAYDKIFLIGHSYGGPSIMIAQPQNITAVSLWDPTFNLPKVWEMNPRSEILNYHIVRFGGVDHLLGAEMMKEATTRYDEEECLALSKNFSAPIQVIGADEGDEANLYAQCGLSWHSGYEGQKDCQKIDGADHMFVKNDSCERLLDITLNWFKEF